MRFSARNQLKGKIVDVKKGTTTAHVRLDIGGQIITALGTQAPNVVALVYVAAFGLDEGESITLYNATARRAYKIKLVDVRPV